MQSVEARLARSERTLRQERAQNRTASFGGPWEGSSGPPSSVLDDFGSIGGASREDLRDVAQVAELDALAQEVHAAEVVLIAVFRGCNLGLLRSGCSLPW